VCISAALFESTVIIPHVLIIVIELGEVLEMHSILNIFRTLEYFKLSNPVERNFYG
jgi:hypothetical protein